MEWIKKYLSKKKPANECEPTQLTLENTRQATLLEFYPDLLGQKSLAEFDPDMIPMHTTERVGMQSDKRRRWLV
jgi:hypothetical protein